ncbi:hypothetical protein ACHAXR_005750 [Thalassiosira sp. AJA248-18]
MTEKNDSDSSIPSHTMHMRRAVEDVRQVMEKLRTKITSDGADVFACVLKEAGSSQPGDKKGTQQLLQSAWLASQRYQDERNDGLQDVHERLSSCNGLPIDTVYMKKDGSSWYANRPRKDPSDTCIENNTCQFKQQYCARNVPCIIQGLDNSHFADISSQWRSMICHSVNTDRVGRQERASKENGGGLKSNSAANKINTEWFRRFVGGDTMVPVRIDHFGTHSDLPNNQDNLKGEHSGLDEDGRAQECETKQMKLDDWIIQCQKQYMKNGSNYLKDWHLVQYLLDKQNDQHIGPPPNLPLYTTPNIFERDLLNKFLQRYSDGGDYKFVYWGPAGSQTRLHSDVLHSFSWSYNVVGKKKWIFYAPDCCDEKGRYMNNADEKRFEVIQHTGEAIFVPSTWKHQVTNLVETLSINHNWITSANIDQTWHCLVVEMAAVEEEVKEWGVVPDDDYSARENMLRGCVGLNVSMFVLMILAELAELLLALCDGEDKTDIVADQDCDGRIWDCAYSIFRLVSVLNDIMRQSNMIQRLEAILESQNRALEAEKYAKEAIKYASRLI